MADRTETASRRRMSRSALLGLVDSLESTVRSLMWEPGRRLPDDGSAQLYPTVTPVNAMRALLNPVLGTRLPLLDDRAWFSTWPRPYVFDDVTAQVK
jgi:hypothetical protein